jgi:hypothetical protein
MPCSMTVTVSYFSFWLDHKAVSWCNLVSDWCVMWLIFSHWCSHLHAQLHDCYCLLVLFLVGSQCRELVKPCFSLDLGVMDTLWLVSLQGIITRNLLDDFYCFLLLLLVGSQCGEWCNLVSDWSLIYYWHHYCHHYWYSLNGAPIYVPWSMTITLVLRLVESQSSELM